MGEPFQISGAGKQSPARPDNPRFTLLVGTPRFELGHYEPSPRTKS